MAAGQPVGRGREARAQDDPDIRALGAQLLADGLGGGENAVMQTGGELHGWCSILAVAEGDFSTAGVGFSKAGCLGLRW